MFRSSFIYMEHIQLQWTVLIFLPGLLPQFGRQCVPVEHLEILGLISYSGHWAATCNPNLKVNCFNRRWPNSPHSKDNKKPFIWLFTSQEVPSCPCKSSLINAIQRITCIPVGTSVHFSRCICNKLAVWWKLSASAQNGIVQSQSLRVSNQR